MKHTWVPEHSTTAVERPFRELRPILPHAGSRYVPRETPTIPMFAAEIRTQPSAPGVGLSYADLRRGGQRAAAKRRARSAAV